MENNEFTEDLPAIWLVFGGSYFNHNNAFRNTPDKREQSLVKLLSSFLSDELSSSRGKKLYGSALVQLGTVHKLLKLWSQDLDLIYRIRCGSGDDEMLVRHMAREFLERIKTFENCTIIPTGLILAQHSHNIIERINGCHDHVSLAILKKRRSHIDWVQVNVGSNYHQECPSLVGEKNNAIFEITGVDLDDITEDWLYLLVGLKAVKPSGASYYKEVTLYECLLVFLNGRTVFQSNSDESFVLSSPISPVRTWQVVDHSFQYLLQHFLGDVHRVVYQRLVTGFKLFLMKKTFDAFKANQTQQCHFLLQEMCRDVAQQAFDQGNEEQKAFSVELINTVKAAIEEHCSQQKLQVCKQCHLGKAYVSSLSFVAPHLVKHIPSSNISKPPNLKVEPVLVKPTLQDDIFGYLEQFKLTFMNRLTSSSNLNEIALLSYGIEVFFIDYLANTDILKTSKHSPFSKDDTLLAAELKELAEIYYSCQAQLVNSYLLNLTYQPNFYAKNVVVQFFVYAAVAALNFRNKCIGPLLATHNLCVATSGSLALNEIIPHLVVEDMAWLRVAFTLNAFFTAEKGKKYLFSQGRYDSKFTFEIENYAEKKDTDVAFAFNLLQRYPEAHQRFIDDYEDLDEEKFNRKWQTLAYTDKYLPSIYGLLSKVAHLAKVSLTGFPSGLGCNSTGSWSFTNTTHRRVFWATEYHIEYKEYWRSIVSFKINSSSVFTSPNNSEHLTSYLLANSYDSYQRLIIHKEYIRTSRSHLLENEIIASQDEKPKTTDSNRYIQLGFLQSEPQIKLERLYIALKEQQLDFCREQEKVLIMQTLFEISIIMKSNNGFCSLLEWTINENPSLIRKLGLLCIEKARAMQYRLTQHHAIGNILEVILALLTFYPLAYKDEFIKGITGIYHMLRVVSMQPPDNLSDQTKLHLNAYLIISVQGNPKLLETETLMVLKAFVAIQTFKAKGVELDNRMLLRVHVASFTWSSWIENNLRQNPTLLNDLMASVIPQWDQRSSWEKSGDGLLFTCNDYTVKPLSGGIYFQNQPVEGLPSTITGHDVFKEYLGKVSFTVLRGSREIDDHEEVPCYFSLDSKQKMRLTLIQNALLIEEFIDNGYHRYLPARQLLGSNNYPYFFSETPLNKKTLRHWLTDDQKIFIKNQNRQIIYEWDLKNNLIFSLQHHGYVVPWDQLQGSTFKAWLKRIELPRWIEIIAHQKSDNSIRIQSLHFPRLGLRFDLKKGKYWCRQVDGYVLVEQQHVNTLHGFVNYLVLEKKEPNSTYIVTKIIIPHRRAKPDGSFFAKTTNSDFDGITSPVYFVYNFDPKTGLLKALHIRAQLYLALLYYCSASLDDHDLSNCNAYRLARENLEICWKDQPFDEVELGIIDQFLNPYAMRDFNSNRIALYLKVVSLLKSSLRLAFLYTDENDVWNKKRSHELLCSCKEYLPFLLSLYLQKKASVFARIRLSIEEEEDVASLISTLQAYSQLNFKQKSQVLSAESKRSYKNHFGQLFCKQTLKNTSFKRCFQAYLAHFSFGYDTTGVNFSAGFNRMLLDRFRLVNFITLYKLAKSSTVSLSKYCYLLHHMVFRAKANYGRFSTELVFLLARTLILVAEKPDLFPESPHWFGVSNSHVELPNRQLTQNATFKAFPSFFWIRPKEYEPKKGDDEAMKKAKKAEEDAARQKAETAYQLENIKIWSNLAKYDLDSHGIPKSLPENPEKFTLEYESKVCFNSVKKRSVVRELYLKAAYNDAMYQFFVSVMQKCDSQKYYCALGRNITPFKDNVITVKFKPEKPQLSISEPVSLENWTVPQQPLIAVDKFFTNVPRPVQNTGFLFEAQLEKPENKYQEQFYKELKNSWLTYHNETELSYTWLKAQSLGELECVLQSKYDQICKKAAQIWDHIMNHLKKRPNGKADNYFALRWYGGQISHYHKGDILRLLVEPHKLADYNPAYVTQWDKIIQCLLNYVSFEINAAKIIQVLGLLDQFKKAENEEEQYSVLQGLVKSLQENIDPASLRYPHWFLFQLENEIIVRENQRELIEAMLNQTEKAMYQLNMGEGKSSVILPLLSNNLADGQQILRINVLSALLITMKNFLRQRFSGLIRKRVYTLPFHRDTDISPGNLKLIFEALQTCQDSRHILLVTPEHRLCLQLKVRELMLENQQQIGATNTFNWQTYRQRVSPCKIEVYKDLTEAETEKLLKNQDERLQTCLRNEKYINYSDSILRVPPRGQGRKAFAQFKETINDRTFREWSCLKAAYRELLYNSSLGHVDSSEKLALLNEISALKTIDLLDESDEILRHGTELNYTIGDKHLFAGEELRWQIPQFFIEAIFCDRELKNVITAGKADGFTVLNEHFRPQGGVPFIQLLDKSYFEKSIKPILVEKFFSENLPTLRKYYATVNNPVVKDEASSLRDYICGQLSLNTEMKIMDFLKDKGQLKDKLLIAKGWLSHIILFHDFNAKYRVQYGLNLHIQGQVSKPIAIPFMGKDSPSPRSEFSHPDVMLGFTIISYLYEGLTQQQLKETLMRLKSKFSHQVADTHLRTWAEASRPWIESQIKPESFPPIMLTSLNNLDLADEQCLKKVHQYLSGNHLAIFFYLDQFILPQEASQYLHKISANAHSLVGYNAALGFSGTDDRKLTMPYQIKSLRSATQEGTNGKLLSVLTQKRNSRYCSLKVEDTNDLLKQLCKYAAKELHCHALIDAGALVTGLSNYEVAVFLLGNLPTNFEGVLYFSDDGNALTVVTRDSKTIAHQDCYLDKQNLFAYLDDIHTRGTDIKLPLNCHAILTISMGMQKDKLMQAAMRLRQLAQKQSVSLWGTEAVTLAIARDNSVDRTKINSFEVIKWVTKNTIEHINADLFPVAVRKINFQFLKKAEVWLKEAPTSLDCLIQYCQEREMFSLEEFYGLSPQCQDLADRLSRLVAGKIKTFWQELEEEMQSKQLTGTAFYEKVFNQSDRKSFEEQLNTIVKESSVYLGTGFVHSSLADDEEKEVEVEIIEEQEVLVKVEKQEARSEQTWDVRIILQKDFITLAEAKRIIMPLSSIRHFIQMPVNLKNIIWHHDIYMTSNFIHTVKCKVSEIYDNYLRPVDVVLIHRPKNKTRIVLLSGHEAALIKATCYHELDDKNLLIHLYDVDGPTQLPLDSTISKEEQKLLTIIRLFSGECHYPVSSEVQRIAKRVGRLYPDYFTHSSFSIEKICSQKLFGILIEAGYLEPSGIMTQKLLKILDQTKSKKSPILELTHVSQQLSQLIFKKLFKIFTKLIIRPSCSLREDHNTLHQWVGTRGRLKEYLGSGLESILNPEHELKYYPKNSS